VGACTEALRNVARHVPDEAPNAVVRLRAVGRSVTISVRDHGPGFDVTRVPTSRLGLSVSITQRMSCVGGRARVVSRPGWGTEVLLRWPAESMPGSHG
jgi:signal transduction histidine kinase